MSTRQLALAFPHEPRFAGADLLPAASNAEARAWLAREAQWPHRRLALWGEAGCGKTHLLHRWAARRGATLATGPGLRFTGRFPAAPLAIDDADLAPERALLHLLNAAAEAGQPLLLAARPAPARWAVTLPDLASRLRATTAVAIQPPEEALLRALLARLLAERQCVVAAPVQDWLLLRLPRSAAAIREAAARLDRAGLAAGRRVSRALAAAVLAEMTGDDDEALAMPPADPILL